MAKQRVVNTRFWDDDYIMELEPNAKLLFLYCITNPLTDLCGAYEITLKRMAFDTGLKVDKIKAMLDKFAADGKMLFRDGWLIVVNFGKHQQGNSPKVALGAARSLSLCPDWVKDTLSKGIDTLSIGGRTLTLTCRDNLDLKGQPLPEPTDMSAVADDETIVFEYWQKTLNHPIAKFTKERKARVRDRLRSYSVDDICRAIDGCKASPHHQGQNDRNTVFDDLELICRNDTQLEKFMGYLGNGKVVLERPNDFDLQKRIERENAPRGEKWAN